MPPSVQLNLSNVAFENMLRVSPHSGRRPGAPDVAVGDSQVPRPSSTRFSELPPSIPEVSLTRSRSNNALSRPPGLLSDIF